MCTFIKFFGELFLLIVLLPNTSYSVFLCMETQLICTVFNRREVGKDKPTLF